MGVADSGSSPRDRQALCGRGWVDTAFFRVKRSQRQLYCRQGVLGEEGETETRNLLQALHTHTREGEPITTFLKSHLP